jgi:ribose transport system permease protein
VNSTDAAGSNARSTINAFRRFRPWLARATPLLLLVGLFIVGTITIDGYTTRRTILSLLVLASFLGLASMGQTLTVIVGGVDLSLPGVIGMANVLTASLYGEGVPFVWVVLIVLGLSLFVGVFNALATVFLRVSAIVTTIGTGLILLGLVQTWGQSHVVGAVPDYLRRAVSVIGTTGPIPIPFVVVLWLVLGALFILIQRRTRIGREVYATGANPVAAKLTHVRTTLAWVFAFAASAMTAGILGILMAGYSGSADATIGHPYLFVSITAIVVGGTSLLGGSGGYGNTLIGVLVITQLNLILVGAGFSAQLQQTLLGCLILILVSFYAREPHVSARI